VLDDVERRRFLVKPPGEDALPLLVGLLHVELNERSGQLLVFPRSGRFARAQPHDRVFPAHRLAGVKRDVLDDAVALVEDPEHGNALRHRRYAALAMRGRGSLPRGGQFRVLLLSALATGGKRKRGKQQCSEVAHAYSGIQGS
jgi:hypothetical protein